MSQGQKASLMYLESILKTASAVLVKLYRVQDQIARRYDPDRTEYALMKIEEHLEWITDITKELETVTDDKCTAPTG